jgi:hypothetical protein
MKRLLLIAAVCVVAAPAMAVDYFPVTEFKALHHNQATGEYTPMDEYSSRVAGRPLWELTDGTVFGSTPTNWMWLDNGDMESPATWNNLQFSYATNYVGNDVALKLAMYENEDNFETDPRQIVALIVWDDLPGKNPSHTYTGWTISSELFDNITMDGQDLDGDGLQDFGYGFLFNPPPATGIIGCVAAGEPNTEYPGAPGIDGGWCFYDQTDDPNFAIDPNLTDNYIGYYSFTDPNILSQVFFALYAPGCPNAGPDGKFCEADVYGFDCLVDLADLAALLSNYGTTTGATLAMGDVDPYDASFPGDGDVDLGDLAELLSQYGNDCNWPPLP